MDCFLDLKRFFSEPPVQAKRVCTIASFYEINEKRANSLAEALLRMVAPGTGFRGGTRDGISWWHPFSNQNYVKTITTKKRRSSLQNERVFGPKLFGLH